MLLLIGCLMGIVSVILSFIELMPFFNSCARLNSYTKGRMHAGLLAGIFASFAWPFRFISLLPKAAPLLLDIVIVVAMGGIGLTGGPTAATISLTISSAASLLVKFYRHVLAPIARKKYVAYAEDWRL